MSNVECRMSNSASDVFLNSSFVIRHSSFTLLSPGWAWVVGRTSCWGCWSFSAMSYRLECRMSNVECRTARPTCFLIRHSSFDIRHSRFYLRVRVPHHREVRRARPCIQLAEERVVRRLRLQLRHLAVRVVEIAEDDRLGRTCLRARGGELAVLDAAVLTLRVDLEFGDALHA